MIVIQEKDRGIIRKLERLETHQNSIEPAQFNWDTQQGISEHLHNIKGVSGIMKRLSNQEGSIGFIL